jgi:hypothetical protein
VYFFGDDTEDDKTFLRPLKTNKMCWSLGVTFTFATIQFGMAYFFSRTSYKYRHRFMLLLVTYGLMEFAEFTNWFALEFTSSGSGSCGTLNKVTTVFAYVLLSWQPVANVLSCMLNVAREKREKFILPLVFMCFAFVLQMVALYNGETMSLFREGAIFLDSVHSVYSDRTCTVVGPGGYLLWKFRVHVDALTPTYFLHLMSGVTLLFIEPFTHKLYGLGGYFGLLSFSYLWFGTSEYAAFWCLSTVVLPFVYLFDFLITCENKSKDE